MARLPALSEVSWIDDFLPEFLWLGLLLDAHGIRRTLRIIEGIVDASPEVTKLGGWLSRTSTWSDLDEDGATDLLDRLESSGHLADLRTAVAPLLAHYPNCPLAFVFDKQPPSGALAKVRESVARGLNRWDEHASWIQISAVYMTIGQGKVHFPPDSVFADFPEVEHFPHTRKSRMIASSSRALINSFPPSERSSASLEWTRYFWARGLELEPCVPISEMVEDE